MNPAAVAKIAGPIKTLVGLVFSLLAILLLSWFLLGRVGQAVTDAVDNGVEEAVEVTQSAVGALAFEAADSVLANAGISERRVMPIRISDISGEALESSGTLGVANRHYTADVQVKITTSGLGRLNDELLCFEGVPFTVFAVQGVDGMTSAFDASTNTTTVHLPPPELLDQQGAFVSGSYSDCHESGFFNKAAQLLPGVSDTSADVLRDQMHVAFQKVASRDDELLVAASCAGADLIAQILDDAYSQQGLSIRLRVVIDGVDLQQCDSIGGDVRMFNEEELADLNASVAGQLTDDVSVLPPRHESLDLNTEG